MPRLPFSNLLLILLLLAAPAYAAQPQPDEARTEQLGDEIRCTVCQAQSINDSNADMAKELRRLVRERIAAGDSDAAIRAYLEQRYGDFILLRPPFRPDTWALWLLPAGIVVTAMLVLGFVFRKRGKP